MHISSRRQKKLTNFFPWETFKTEEGAKSRKIAIESELRNGTFLVPNQITVRELFEQWLPIQSRKHKWAPATYVGTVAQAQNLIFPYIGNLEVQKVRSYHIEKLYSLLSQTPCGLYSQGERQELSEKQKKRLLSGTTIHEVHTLLFQDNRYERYALSILRHCIHDINQKNNKIGECRSEINTVSEGDN